MFVLGWFDLWVSISRGHFQACVIPDKDRTERIESPPKGDGNTSVGVISDLTVPSTNNGDFEDEEKESVMSDTDRKAIWRLIKPIRIVYTFSLVFIVFSCVLDGRMFARLLVTSVVRIVYWLSSCSCAIVS